MPPSEALPGVTGLPHVAMTPTPSPSPSLSFYLVHSAWQPGSTSTPRRRGRHGNLPRIPFPPQESREWQSMPQTRRQQECQPGQQRNILSQKDKAKSHRQERIPWNTGLSVVPRLQLHPWLPNSFRNLLWVGPMPPILNDNLPPAPKCPRQCKTLGSPALSSF